MEGTTWRLDRNQVEITVSANSIKMKKLPPDIKEIFYKTIQDEISLDDFENWLYTNKEIEILFPSDDYLELISLNFKKSGAKYELWKLLQKHIDPGDFEQYKMLGLLYEARQKTNRLPFILKEFYDLYCSGYNFLQELGIGYGLTIEVPRINTETDTWEDLTEKQQKQTLDGFSPGLEEEISKVIHWIETKKIRLTGKRDEIGHYRYQDLRTEKEKNAR